MGYYTEKALQVKAKNDAKIAELEEALNVVGVQTAESMETVEEEVFADAE